VSKQNFDLLDLPKNVDDLLAGTAFTGAGQFALFEFAPGTEVNRFRFSFQEPYLFDKPISLTFGGFLFQRDREEYTENRFGGNVALGKRLTRDIGVELAYSWQLIEVDDVDFNAPEDIMEIEGANIVSTLRLSLGIDKRDNPVMTRKGFRGGITQELFGGPIGGDYDFYRIGGNWSSYWTLFTDSKNRPVTLAATAKTGVMLAFSDTDETPPFERYFGGGSGDVRGFDFRGIGPRQGNDPVGGDAQFTASVQVGVPLYEELLRGIAFLDAGSVTEDYGDLFTTMRASVGGGLQIFVPFLGPRPLELTYAVPLASEPGDDEQQVQFSMSKDL
jgi:outer membrane protein insertion porin family